MRLAESEKDINYHSYSVVGMSMAVFLNLSHEQEQVIRYQLSTMILYSVNSQSEQNEPRRRNSNLKEVSKE